MRSVLALVLLVHGVAHLPGFLSAWRLATLPELPYRTTVLAGHLDVGDGGARLVGLGWLLAAVACWSAAATLVVAPERALPVVLCAVGASLVLSVLGWPEARLGLLVNVVLLGALTLLQRHGFAHPVT